MIPGKSQYAYSTSIPGGRMFNGGPNVTNSAFSLPLGGNAGNAPRNTLRGFGAYQVNLAVRREFLIRDQVKLQVRLDTFNIFNHPNFGYIDPVLTDYQFGQSTRMLNQSFGSTGSLYEPGGPRSIGSLYEPGGPRSIQLALRLHF